jgi:hypothetical protein
VWWNREEKSVYDVFDEVKPDVFIGTTYDWNSALTKYLTENPLIKLILIASDWGPMCAEMDPAKFPTLRVRDDEKKTIEELKKKIGQPSFVLCNYHRNQHDKVMSGWREIGIEPSDAGMNACDLFSYSGGKLDPQLKCDASIVSGWWPYKSINLGPYILPLLNPVGKYNIKIFGNQGNWGMAAQFLGYLPEHRAKDLFTSSLITLNIQEPHATTFGHELNERFYKGGLEGFIVSDYVASVEEDIFGLNCIEMAKTPQEFHEKVDYFVKNPDKRLPYMANTRKKILGEHTYFHRVRDMFQLIGFHQEAKDIEAQRDMFRS